MILEHLICMTALRYCLLSKMPKNLKPRDQTIFYQWHDKLFD